MSAHNHDGLQYLTEIVRLIHTQSRRPVPISSEITSSDGRDGRDHDQIDKGACGARASMRDLDGMHCGRQPDPKDCYVADLRLTLEEQIALTLARLFFQSFAGARTDGWVAAMAEAEARFGYRNGPIVAARLLAALQAIRRSRISVFMFNSPACPGCSAIATEHERRMMRALSALRRGEATAARAEIVMLCEGRGADRVVSALYALGRALDGDVPANARPFYGAGAAT